MKVSLVSLTTLLLVLCSEKAESSADSVFVNSETTTHVEDFYIFLENFSSIEDFQLSRISFPLPDCIYPGNEKSDCQTISKDQWEMVELIDTSNGTAIINNIYDNFDLRTKDSGERVVAFEAIETNVCTYYFFKRKTLINGNKKISFGV